MLTNDRGVPRQLNAEYQGRSRGNLKLAWCDDLRTNVVFNPSRLNISDLRPGTAIGPITISIGYRGLAAERGLPIKDVEKHARAQ